VRKLFYFLLVCLFSLTSKVTAKDNDSFVIRRAYLDVLGFVPTIEEIEWYCVYNTNGYTLAIDWLLTCEKHKWIIPKEYSRILLLSNEYKTSPKMRMPKQQVYKNLLYVTGSQMTVTPENVQKASVRLIESAIACSNGDTEIIDYMCESMMSRSSNLEENNKLSKIVKDSSKPEMDTWMDVLGEILELEDVNCK
jgi:hypothetical protein